MRIPRALLLLPLLTLMLAAPQAQADQSSEADISAKAAKRAKAKISILPWPGQGLVGYVDSSDKRCKSNRQVVLFKKRSDGRLVRVGKARAKLKGGGHQWLKKVKGGPTGNFVAKVATTSRCAPATARKSIAPKGPNGYPECPSLQDICQFTEMHIEEWGRTIAEPACKTGFGRFNASGDYTESSTCLAQSESGPEPWCCWENAHARWNNRLAYSQKKERTWGFHTRYQDSDSSAYIRGTLPHTDSDRFTVTTAYAKAWKVPVDTYYRTPDLPNVGPGQVGGPLHFDFHPPIVSGFDFYIYGYLYRK